MQSPTPVITLRAGGAEVGVAPALGGSITRYRSTAGTLAHDWLRDTRAADLASGAADRLACFPLVPFSNRIRDGRFAFGAHSIRLPLNCPPEPHAQHGQGWQARWTVVDSTADRLAIEYVHPAGAWPFPYRALQDIALSVDALEVTLRVENRGRESMPAGFGLHPYFPRTAQCRISADVGAMWATDAEVMPTTLTVADPRLSTSEGLPIAGAVLDNGFTGWGRTATIAWPESGARLVLEADPPLDFLVVYTPAGENYFCVEPVSHCTDAFNLAAQGRGDTGMLTLDPGESLSATVRFRPSLAKG